MNHSIVRKSSGGKKLLLVASGVMTGTWQGLLIGGNRESRVVSMKSKWIGLVLVASIGLAQSQTVPVTRPEFDVASIKLNTSAAKGGQIQSRRGNFSVENLPLRNLILLAYGLRDFQLAGGPSWIDSERYDVTGKTDSNTTVGFAHGALIVQSLLEDRFRLKVHHETREGAVYFLTVAKSGLKMPQSKEGSCKNLDLNHMPPPSVPDDASAQKIPNCGTNSGPIGRGRLNIRGVTVADVPNSPFQSLASHLSEILGRTVVDRTGLSGNFELHLEWTPGTPSVNAGTGTEDNPGSTNSADAGAPSIFTAVQEQLGLKLESGRGPVDILVIDHVERPSKN